MSICGKIKIVLDYFINITCFYSVNNCKYVKKPTDSVDIILSQILCFH